MLGHTQLWGISKETLTKGFTLKPGPATSRYSGYRKVPLHRIHTNSSCISTVFCKVFMTYLDVAAWVG